MTTKIEKVTLYVATEIFKPSDRDQTSAMDNILTVIDTGLYDTVVFSYESEEMELTTKPKPVPTSGSIIWRKEENDVTT